MAHDRHPSDEVIFRVLTGRARDTEQDQVGAWRGRAPENEVHCQALARFLSVAARADSARYRGDVPAAEQIVARAAIEADRRTVSRLRARTRGWWRRGLVAAALMLVGIGLSRAFPNSGRSGVLGGEEFVTSATETATVGLRDGTVVRLAPNSKLRLMGGEAGRTVALAGRAYFAVARDEARPFLVHTSAGVVRVLGTRFDLETGAEDLRVVVIEGSVALAARGKEARVEAGEMGRVIRGNPLPAVEVADSRRPIDWVGRFLAFQETPFREAVREIGQQYGVTVELEDSVLAERTITAWFVDWTLAEVLDVVCPVIHAECAIEGDVVNATPRAR